MLTAPLPDDFVGKLALRSPLWWWLINTGFITQLPEIFKIHLLFENFMHVWCIFIILTSYLPLYLHPPHMHIGIAH